MGRCVACHVRRCAAVADGMVLVRLMAWGWPRGEASAVMSVERAGMAANQKLNLKPCLKYKFIPNPKIAAEVRLRSVLGNHNVREERRRVSKRAVAISLKS